ncbi:DUF4266 domain-containing protein [Moritella marina ATCC 15381]|uniref:DUF4266 domain-containing protein n=1 Tax=Moritella marina ATCC 15381 TaxID=1202962 RepID=A0A5J6WIX1_MORMI|nr:DUF4266 domain-containing protein [Moritella marina]QFI38016.1 DUF4266 domain-containing protein [Moritella marina ATCC 15381]
MKSMKHYSPLTLLSSSLFIASFSLQAEVVQIEESVSRVVHQGQQSVSIVESSVVPVKVKPFENEPKAVLIAPVEVSHITVLQPELMISEPAAAAVRVPVLIAPPIMPTTVPENPILNTRALARQEASEELEDASLFSAISDWFSVKPVKPWQKGTLAKKAMKPGGEVPEFDVFSEKVFAYKQGSIGGNGVGGGGCGCN